MSVIALPPFEAREAQSPPLYAELAAISNFSFLRGGSHPEELVEEAISKGLSGLGLCDRNSFAGVVRGLVASRDLEARNPHFRFLVGICLVLIYV